MLQSGGIPHGAPSLTRSPYPAPSPRRSHDILQNRRGSIQSPKLTDFVKRLEQALYKASRTKVSLRAQFWSSGASGASILNSLHLQCAQEEYMDPASLEIRLQEVARQFVNVKQNGAAAGASSATSRPSMQMGGPPAATMQAMGQVPMGMVPNGGPHAGSGFVPTPPDGLATAHESPAQMQMAQAAFRGGNGAPSPAMPSDMGPGMVPNPGHGGGSMLMHNGAPIMIKGQGGSGFPTGPYMNVSARWGARDPATA